VTGGAGFVGSHLCDALIARGEHVTCLDNLSSGSMTNLERVIDHPAFCFLEQDVAEDIAVDGPVDLVVHLASPASPADYLAHPLETLAAGSEGT
jgi:dTDP-glucose 4,6-dehydratase